MKKLDYESPSTRVFDGSKPRILWQILWLLIFVWGFFALVALAGYVVMACV